MKVFLTGATGFVGSHVLPALLAAGHEVQALVRMGAERKIAKAARENPKLSIFHGDATNAPTLEGAGEGCEAFIHLIGIIEDDPSNGITYEKYHVEATRNVVDLARKVGAKRFLFMSALGTRDQAESEYHRTKYRAEALVRGGGMAWTIFRPSLIFGKGDGFVNQQKQFIHSVLPVVVPGTGKTLFQPVAIEDVVAGFVKSLDDPKAAGQVYEIGGPARLTLNEIIDRIAKAKGVSPGFKLHPPVWLLKPVAGIMHYVWPGFPVNKEQVVMLQEDSICESKGYFGQFGIEKPKEFSVEALKAYI